MRALVLALLLLLRPLSAFAGLDEGLAAYQRRDWVVAARELAPPAAERNPAAQARLGHIRLLGLGAAKNEAEGLALLTAAATAGNAVGQFWLANAYLAGWGLPRDMAVAVQWLTKAADQGLPNAQVSLGDLKMRGFGMEKDEAGANALFQRAFDAGMVEAGSNLAASYWNARGVAQDRTRAVAYARPAAEAGWPAAQKLLGVAYWQGEGFSRDQQQGVMWFRKAAERGEPGSAHNLGLAYGGGVGVARDPALAYFWHLQAAHRAPPADRSRFEKARDAAAAKLPIDEAAKIRYRLASWSPLPPGTPASVEAAPPIPAAQPLPPQPGDRPGITPAPAPPQAAVPPPPPKFSAGSGMLVSRDGAVLTNHHVIDKCRNLRVQTADTAWRAANILAQDAVNDLALLKTAFRPADVARFREDQPLRSGDQVVVVGFPLSNILSREANVTAGVVSAMAGIRGDKRFYQLTAPVQKGNSGGPLADMSGNVVGIVSSKLNAMTVADRTGDLPQNINFAIKAELARKFMQDNAVAFETAPSPTNLSAADVGERIKKVTVFVECEVAR
ncbi:MAG: trypsin-like peptidase domain-containing protein [Magnetospirillum sp.]|nr:trypsin-like peptidase domain-containing protein [Magnetospirillum sp.]